MTHKLTETIEIPGGEVTLRPLTVHELARVFKSHGPKLFALFDQGVNNFGTTHSVEGVVRDSIKIALEVVKESPSFMAHFIALSADEADAKGFEAVRQLPFATTLMLYEKATALTFGTQTNSRKFLAEAIRLAKASDVRIIQQ